ncbi:hypothetical protein [Parapedobacter tibetensis]|uniref:hypothetical protein n=1 Tax=Parapedobacter tibetensis TaxID=2972951 RepID=UPI00214DD7E5|nr:hypothetical protein [Parapedobacter tibetensis]
MKTNILLFITLLCSHMALAQKHMQATDRMVTAYNTVVKMKTGRIKGVLQQVTDSNIVVKNLFNGYDYIPVEQVETIHIKFNTKTHTYKIQSYAFDDERLFRNQHGFIDLDEPLNQHYLERTVGENLAIDAAGIIGTRGLNGMKRLFTQDIARYRIRYDRNTYLKLFDELKFFAVDYQLSPEFEADLLKIFKDTP